MTEIPQPESSVSQSLDAALEPFPYQLELVDYLKSQERDLWSWFASASYLSRYADSVRLDLLKATYRFDPPEHARIYELAHEAREELGIRAPVTIYQVTNSDELNAALAFVPGEVHLLLEGGVTRLLTEEELKAALAHELTHYVLWERFDGDFLVAHQLLGGVAGHPHAARSHLESARLFSLYMEIHADRGSLFVMKNPLATIRSLIKIQTGLADVHAESYLRQADEIFSHENVRTSQLTHPESFIRARALHDWSERQRDSFPEVARMIEGTTELDALDLVGQARLSGITRQLVAAFLTPKWLQTEAVLSHARKFFPDLIPGGVLDENLSRTIAVLDPTIRKYLSYVLLDFTVIDPDLEDVPIAAAIDASHRCGLGEPMIDLVTKELALPKKRLAKLEQERAQLLAAAERQAQSEASR